MSGPRVGVLVGNPRRRSRTYAAALAVAEGLAGDEGPAVRPVVDLADLGPALLDHGAAEVAEVAAAVQAVDVLVVASPTYKGTYTGILKVFLDRLPGGALAGVVAVPVMVAAGPRHAMAAEWTLRPVLAELGASVPVPALCLLEADVERPDAVAGWLATARPLVHAVSSHPLPEGAHR